MKRFLLARIVTIAALGAAGCGGDEEAANTGTGGSAATGTASSGPGGGAGSMPAGAVDVVRDADGVAHVFGGSRAAAFYGLGYATAEDRLFQMDYHRRFMRGRLAEVWGSEQTAHDVRMRTLGWGRHADLVVAHPEFPAEERTLLEAYAAGVNAFVAKEGFSLPALFAELGIAFDPWAPADSLLAWERLREAFGAADFESEIGKLRDCEDLDYPSKDDPMPGCSVSCDAPIDEAAAVVPFTDPWPPPEKTASLATPRPPAGPPVVKASHGWAVRGTHTTTGKPVLAFDPKASLRAPSFLYHFHVSAPDLEARGAGLAGAPAFLVFWNRHLGHTLSAGAADLADLYEVELTSDATGYVLDGKVVPLAAHEETIAVKGEPPQKLKVSATHHGPIVTRMLAKAPPGREFAARHAELAVPSSHSLVGAIRAMAATTLEEYRSALDAWIGPSANSVFAALDPDDPRGHVGYHLLGGIPWRAKNLVQGLDLTGRHPYDGTKSANDWQGMLTVNERPFVVDPKEGYTFTANHLPVGSWYEAFAYTGVSSGGDGERSYRLRHVFDALLGAPGAKATPEEIHAVHFDMKSDTVRVFRDLLAEMKAGGRLPSVGAEDTPGTPPEMAAKTLSALDLWQTASVAAGELRHKNPQARIAMEVATLLPGMMRAKGGLGHPELVCKYNGSYAGVHQLLKAFVANPEAVAADPYVVAFAVDVASASWKKATFDASGAPLANAQDPSLWKGSVPPPPFTVAYQDPLDCPLDATEWSCSIDPALSFDVGLDAEHTETILSTAGSWGTGTADFADIDASVQAVPMGASEDPSSPFFKSQLDAVLGADEGAPASTPPAPLSRALIEPLATSIVSLTYAP
jgi:penicillin amidase